MTSNTFYTLAVFAIVLLIITKPIGLWLTPIAQGRAPAVVDAIDRRLISVLAPSGREESWQRYAVSLLTFNTLGLIFLYVLQRIQGWLPLKEALQKPPLPSRMEHKCSVRLLLTTPECAVFLPMQ